MMNKNNVRAFAIGILFSVSLIGSSCFFMERNADENRISNAEKVLESAGFYVLTPEQYEELMEKSKNE